MTIAPGNVAQHCGHQGRVAIFERGLQVSNHVLHRFQMVRRIPRPGLSLGHRKLLQFSRQFERPCDISVLRTLIAAGEQDYQGLVVPHKYTGYPGP
jgi:hypothetical protein